MGWRNCAASFRLAEEVNRRWPNRSRVSDGTIGDTAHQSRSAASDHNPFIVLRGEGIVRARDITAAGIDAPWLAEYLRKRGQVGDPRLTHGGYIIFNRRITSPDFKGWKVYTGSNPHTAHVHVSFSRLPAGFDSTADWGIAPLAAPTPTPRLEDPLMALSDAEQRELLDAARSVLFGIAGVRAAGPTALALDGIGQDIKALRSEVGALLGKPSAQVDTAAVVAGVVDAITKQGIGPLVADELARRLAS